MDCKVLTTGCQLLPEQRVPVARSKADSRTLLSYPPLISEYNTCPPNTPAASPAPVVRANFADDASDLVNMDASCQQNPAGKSLEMITSRVEPNRLPTSPPPPPRATFSTPHGEVGGELRFVAATVEIGEIAEVEPTTAASRRRTKRRLIMMTTCLCRRSLRAVVAVAVDLSNDGCKFQKRLMVMVSKRSRHLMSGCNGFGEGHISRYLSR